MLLGNQLAGIQTLTQQNVLVKVNIVMIQGINDRHIPAMVKTVKRRGAFITNIMPLIPAPGSVFENHAQTSRKDLETMRTLCEAHLPQMRHCRQCRADAIGLLHEDRSAEFRTVAPAKPAVCGGKNYKIAVATQYGEWVDQHFGHASEFAVYTGGPDGFSLAEKSPVSQYCLGVDECDQEEDRRGKIISTLSDCDAVLTMRIGYHAKQRLQARGILSVENCDTVENSLLFAQQELEKKESA